MRTTAKQLKEQRAVHGEVIRQLADKITAENRDFTAGERKEWDTANAQWNALTRQIEVERQESRRESDDPGSNTPGLEDRRGGDWDRERRGGRPDGAEEVRALAIQGWVLRAHGREITARHRRACRASGINPGSRTLALSLPRRPERRSLSVGTGSAGGYTVPTGFVPTLEVAMKQYAQVRQVADVMRTPDGRAMPWPSANDTGNVGEMIDENTAVASADPSFGKVDFGAFKFSSKMVTLSSELLEDEAVHLAAEIGVMLGERIGRAQAPKFTTGSGTGEPQGIVTAATLGVTAASTTDIDPDEIIDLIHSVDPVYRQDPSFGLMMSDSVLAYIRKLKDANGRPLFADKPADGFAGRIHGVGVTVNVNMSTTFGTGEKLILAGAFKKFKIRDVNTVRLRRLDERYAEYDQTAFIAFFRSDSKLLDAGTHPVKYLALA